MRRKIARILEPRIYPRCRRLLRDLAQIRREVFRRARFGRLEVRRVTNRRAVLVRLDRMTSLASHRLEQALAFFDEAGIFEVGFERRGLRMRGKPVLRTLR